MGIMEAVRGKIIPLLPLPGGATCCSLPLLGINAGPAEEVGGYKNHNCIGPGAPKTSPGGRHREGSAC